MESIHTSKNKASLEGLDTGLLNRVSTFINKHADVFEALSRSATPFGSN